MRDINIRTAVREGLNREHAGDPETCIVEELCVPGGRARIDLVVVNGVLHGYEFKSDQDTLSRLPEQAFAYAKVFDRLTLVVGERHLCRAVLALPEWWGIRVAHPVRNRLVFRDLKLSQANPCVDPVCVAKLLRRDEAMSLLTKLCTVAPSERKSRDYLCRALVDTVELPELCDLVRKYIRGRQFVATQL